MEELHNLFFYINVCHICKSFGKDSPSLKRCSSCKLISYCGKKHQKKHWPQHKDLCKVVCKMFNEAGQGSLYGCTTNLDMESWAQAKMNLMLVVALKLGRKLLPYEEQIFKYPRTCAICHESDARFLKDCLNCPNSSFCQEHYENSVHWDLCESFKLCFELDNANAALGHRVPRCLIPYHLEKINLPTSIGSYIEMYTHEDRTLIISAKYQDVYISEYLTRVLTLLYAMEKLKYIPGIALTLHIIGANIIEVASLEAWETLLHWFPTLTLLKVILVGPEFTSHNKNIPQNICDCCVEKGMKLEINLHGCTYKNYIESECFVKPDIIIGYNLGLSEYEDIDSANDEWADSLCTLPKQTCPFIFTSYTPTEATRDHERLCAVLEKTVTYLCCEKNPFSSRRPHRDYETEGVYYQNQYVTIYKDLN